MNAIPRKITPCPLINVIAEVRFGPALDPDAVWGILFSVFRHKFPKVVQLPLSEIPRQIRESDKSLRFQPHYQMRNEHFILQIGPRTLSLSVPSYPGWTVFRELLDEVLGNFGEAEVAKGIERVSTRFINFFEKVNIFDNLQLSVRGEGMLADLPSSSFQIQSEKIESSVTEKLQVLNSATVERSSESRQGSVVDVDIISLDVNLDDIMAKIDHCHDREKELFFALLNPRFVDTLNPEY